MIHCAITTHAEDVPAAAYATVDGVCRPRCQMHIARARRDGCTVRLRPLTPEPETVTVTRAPPLALPNPEPTMSDTLQAVADAVASTPLNRNGITPNRRLLLFLRPDADAHPELCRVDGCTGKVKNRGGCGTHLTALTRGSDPTAILLPRADRSEAARKAAATRARMRGETVASAPVVEQPGPAEPVTLTRDGNAYMWPSGRVAIAVRLTGEVWAWADVEDTPSTPHPTAEDAAAHLGARLLDPVCSEMEPTAPDPTPREQELQAQVEEQAGQIRRLEARIKGADATNDAMARSLSDIDAILDTTGAAPGQTTTERVRALASRTAPPPDQRLQAIAAELLADLDDVTDAGEAWGIHLVRALRLAVGVES